MMRREKKRENKIVLTHLHYASIKVKMLQIYLDLVVKVSKTTSNECQPQVRP